MKKISLVGVAVISVLFALACGEVALRWAGFEFVFYPARVEFGWPDPATLKDLYQTDSDLFWVPKDYFFKVADWKGKRPTVVFMGDSCTEFGGYDQALRSIISEQKPGSIFSFVNMGVAGWSSFQGLQQLKRDILPMLPRFITIYYGWNDHWVNFGIEDKDVGKFRLQEPSLVKAFSSMRLVQLANKAVFVFQQAVSAKGKRKQRRVAPSDFKSNILQIIKIARQNNIIPVLFTAPSFHKSGQEPDYLASRWLPSPHQLIPLHEEYVQVVRDISFEENVPLVDLYAEFNLLPEQARQGFFLKDGIHLTKAGDRKLAEFIYKCFFINNLDN